MATTPPAAAAAAAAAGADPATSGEILGGATGGGAAAGAAGGALGREPTREELEKALGECVLNSSWMFSVAGAAIAIPVGIRRKSLAPLLFFGTTGAMLDIIQGVSNCEREREELKQFLAHGGKGEGIPAAAAAVGGAGAGVGVDAVKDSTPVFRDDPGKAAEG